MFISKYIHSVDIKGRIIVPSKLRDELGEKFIITAGLDGCLFIYPLHEWERFVENLKEKVKENAKGRKIQRRFMSLANECEIDKQGRILIPTELRNLAEIELEDKAVFAGVGNKIELWSKEKWDEENNFDEFDEEEDISSFLEDIDISF